MERCSLHEPGNVWMECLQRMKCLLWMKWFLRMKWFLLHLLARRKQCLDSLTLKKVVGRIFVFPTVWVTALLVAVILHPQDVALAPWSSSSWEQPCLPGMDKPPGHGALSSPGAVVSKTQAGLSV